MVEIWDKAHLYYQVGLLRKRLHNFTYPLKAFDIAGVLCKNPQILELNFESSKVCGMLHRGNMTTSIGVNMHHEAGQKNYYATHEILHYVWHDTGAAVTICNDAAKRQDFFAEWQANEGAAELLVPYRDFIPIYIETAHIHARAIWSNATEKDLANIFGVSERVILNRVKNLRYEIYQYSNGVSLDEIDILSENRQRVLNLNAFTTKKKYCLRCLSPIKKSYLYCTNCGTSLQPKRFLDIRSQIGDGYMLYPGIELDHNSRVLQCPICSNESILDGDYCKICGNIVVNKCTADPKQVGYDEYEECNALLDGDARYCFKCGAESTFLKHGYLKEWQETSTSKPLYFPSGEDNTSLEATGTEGGTYNVIDMDDDDGDLPF